MKIQGSKQASRRGTAMLYAVFGAFSAATIVALMLTMSLASNRMSSVKAYGGRAEYLAEGGVEAAKQVVLQAVASWQEPSPTGQAVVNGRTVDYTIAPTGFQTTLTDPTGLQTIVTTYMITATANVLGHSFTSRRMVNAEATPVFQYAVFYNRDLEINPGPSMTLGGRVHSNGDMYLNTGNASTLKVDTNYLRAVGGIYRYRKDNPSLSTGTVNVRQWVVNPFDPSEPAVFTKMHSQSQLAAAGVPAASNPSGYDSNFVDGWDANGNGIYTDPGDFLPWGPGALAYWKEPGGYMSGTGNTVLTAAHGTTAALPPPASSVAMFEPAPSGVGDWTFDGFEYQHTPGAGTHDQGFYHANAGLSLIGFSNGTWKAFDHNGLDITSSLPAGTVTTKQVYDARQKGKVNVLELDMAMLNSSGKFPGNGLIYASHYDLGTGVNAKGLKVKNASQLANKLTIVSEGSLYLHGDYNTSGKKPAAVIADAVNLLSNAWNDSKTSSSGLPTASATTYNVAMVTGTYDTSGSTYNGGLENLPRFHENWSGKACTIWGSFVNFWESQHATGLWVYGGNVYQAPSRNWFYDPLFNSVANLPPFTPMAVHAEDVVYW
jgi:hypothetical protein